MARRSASRIDGEDELIKGARFPVAVYNEGVSEDKTASPTFEAGLEELERIVKELERGDLPLEQSLALFEKGMRLSADCKRQLEEAESRVEILMKRGSDVVAAPFPADKPVK